LKTTNWLWLIGGFFIIHLHVIKSILYLSCNSRYKLYQYEKNLLLLVFSLFFLTNNAQTYVSGGIYASTTWTKASSPYIVTDTVVVFPGVTLTIDPGVTVKFVDTSIIEVRESILKAIGLPTDPIIFTSNSAVLKASNWGGIVFNKKTTSDTIRFRFCTFQYAYRALDLLNFSTSKLFINHCTFSDNYQGVWSEGYCQFDSSSFKNMVQSGIYGLWGINNINHCTFSKCLYGIDASQVGTIQNCQFDSNSTAMRDLRNGLVINCDITNNEYGIDNPKDRIRIKNCRVTHNDSFGILTRYGDSVLNNTITNNGIGIQVRFSNITKNIITNNRIGIHVIDEYYTAPYMSIYCNKICSNTDYDIKYEVKGSSNPSYPNNYFCTPDSLSTRPRVFDGYVDIKYGLVNYMPLDTSCYKTLGVKENKLASQNNLKLYPNPFTNTATLEFDNPQSRSHQLSVFNTLGQLVMSIGYIKSNKFLIDRKDLQSGLYFYQLHNEDALVGSGKMMLE
jgi:hypothetical protein